MAGGGLAILAARGCQDVHLTSQPQVTWFKSVFRRYTPFARETIEQSFSGQVAFGRPLQACISRNGDLVGEIYAVFQLPAIEPDTCQGSTAVHWTNEVGYALIREVSVHVGGHPVDSHYGEWLAVYEELNLPPEHHLDEAVGRRYTVRQLIEDAKCPHVYIVPLRFWFNLNPGLYLPLIAMQYHDVKISLHLRRLDELWVSKGNPQAVPLKRGTCTPVTDNDIQASLWVNYIYLDGIERCRFAQSCHEYLIQTLQYTTASVSGNCAQSVVRVPLNFNHPIKYLVWTIQEDGVRFTKNWFNYGDLATGNHLLHSATIRFNNHRLFEPMPFQYFWIVQNWEAFVRAPPEKHIYSYHWDLDSKRLQPTGTANFSRLDNASLDLVLLKPALNVFNTVFNQFGQSCCEPDCFTVVVWAVSLNVFRILAGKSFVVARMTFFILVALCC